MDTFSFTCSIVFIPGMATSIYSFDKIYFIASAPSSIAPPAKGFIVIVPIPFLLASLNTSSAWSSTISISFFISS